MTIKKKCWGFIRNNGIWKFIAVLMLITGFFARDAYTRLWERQAQLETKTNVTRELVNIQEKDIGIMRTQMTHWAKAVNENTVVLRDLHKTIVELRLELERRRQ